MNDGPNYPFLILCFVVLLMILGMVVAMESVSEAEQTIRKAMECRQGVIK